MIRNALMFGAVEVIPPVSPYILIDSFINPVPATNLLISAISAEDTSLHSGDSLILGNARHIKIHNWTGTTGSALVDCGEGNTVYSVSPGADCGGEYEITWGDPDGFVGTSYNGLGSVDITANGANVFKILLEESSLTNIALGITLWDGSAALGATGTGVNTYTPIPLADNTCLIEIPYNDWTLAGFDLTDVGKITLHVSFSGNPYYAKILEIGCGLAS